MQTTGDVDGLPFVHKTRSTDIQSDLFDGDVLPELVVEPGDLDFEATPEEIMRRLRRICDNAETTVKERGVTTLFLTFGVLRWRDDQFGESVSPLWMAPCEVLRKSPDAPLHLRMADEELQVNPALEYYLREKHKVQLPDIPDEPDGAAAILFRDSVTKLVQPLKWTVTEDSWLSMVKYLFFGVIGHLPGP